MLKSHKFKEMIPCSITKSLEATLNLGYVSAQGMGSHWDLISEVILFSTVVVGFYLSICYLGCPSIGRKIHAQEYRIYGLALGKT